jgi:drug/metabolite transporter (DMT)-like permease
MNMNCNDSCDKETISVIFYQEKSILSKTKLAVNKISNDSKFELFKGLLFSSLSALCFSLCSTIVKHLKELDPSELAIFRFSGIFLLSLPQILFNKLNPFGPRELRHLLILRGISGGISLLLRFMCIHHLPIAEASVIIFSFPVVVTIMAKILLKVLKKLKIKF